MIVTKEISNSCERFFATVRLDIIFSEPWNENFLWLFCDFFLDIIKIFKIYFLDIIFSTICDLFSSWQTNVRLDIIFLEPSKMLTFFWTNKTGCQTMVIHIKVHTECSGFWHLVVLEIEIVIFKCQGHIIRDTFLLLWCNRESKVTHTLFPENYNQFEVTRDLKEGRCPNFLDLTFAPAVI